MHNPLDWYIGPLPFLFFASALARHNFYANAFSVSLEIGERSLRSQLSTHSAFDDEAKTEMEPTGSAESATRIAWVIRPATPNDRTDCQNLLEASYKTLLAADYSSECLDVCLPLIVVPREELLTCQTWYVAEHPVTGKLVGCGGWTVGRPKSSRAQESSTRGSPKENSDQDETRNAEHAPDPAPVPHLRHFAVHPKNTRMGIASAVMRRSLLDIGKYFEKLNIPFPELEVYSTLTAQSFYASSAGFVSVKRIEMELVEGTLFPAVLMRRDRNVAEARPLSNLP